MTGIKKKRKPSLLSPSDKINILSRMPEIIKLVAILGVAYKDIGAKSFIRLAYEIEGKNFELIFQEVKKGTVK